jgi:enoyl-CoA hydratase/carnithine racemase
MTKLANYENRFKHVRFRREDGIIQMQIHKNGASAQWEATEGGIHQELGDAFWEVAHDSENRVVILTGAGDAFLEEADPIGVPPALTAGYWDRIYKEGKDLIHNMLDIEVPVISAVNGNAFIHSELPALADIVLAADTAKWADKAHFPNYTAPADGVHVVWTMLLGSNRGRYFLLSAEEISSQEMKRMNVVAEVLPKDKLLPRAWELAREMTKRPQVVLRMTRVAFVQHLKRRLLDDLGYGLLAEGLGILSFNDAKLQQS